MKTLRFLPRLVRVSSACVALLSSALIVGAADLGLPQKLPEAIGFDSARLERVGAMLKREVDAQHYAGAVWLVARNGAVASHGAVGLSDVAAKTSMTEDTPFRIFSMTKIVTTVTLLTLVEEGRINLDDPVERFLPPLANRQVLVGGTADAPQLEAAKQPITIRNLLTHTSGFTYDLFAADPMKTIWERAKLWDSSSLDDFIRRLATLPLGFQPGAKWEYGMSTDVLGAVIQAVTGQDLEAAMRQRVFTPLGMTRTTFRPDAATLVKAGKIHTRNPDGKLVEDHDWDRIGSPSFASGGGGLFSTLHDYARFAQMLLNNGELDGRRVLGRKTVEIMSSNQIAHLKTGGWVPAGFGFGVRVQPEDAHTASAIRSAGAFGWDGAATTFVSMDPKERLFVLLLMQHVPYNDDRIFDRFENTVYGALK